MQNILVGIANGLNAIRSNVWAVALICVGVTLILKGHPTEGGSLLTGAFAVFRASKDDEVVQTQVLSVPQNPTAPTTVVSQSTQPVTQPSQ